MSTFEPAVILVMLKNLEPTVPKRKHFEKVWQDSVSVALVTDGAKEAHLAVPGQESSRPLEKTARQ
jgi:hypothetical protein